MKNLGLIVCAIVALFAGSASAQQVVSLAIGDFQVKSKNSSALVSDVASVLESTRKFVVADYAELEESLRKHGHDPKRFISRKNQETELLDKSGIHYLLQGSVKNSVSGTTKVDVELIKIARDGKPLINTDGVLSTSFKPLASSDAQQQTVDAIRDLVIAALFPVRVVSTSQENEFMLNYGQGLLAVGDILQVPSNAQVLEQDSLPLKLTVTRVGKKFAHARVVEGTGELKPGMVLRLSGSHSPIVN